MLLRLYTHNFRCLENFELDLEQQPATLLIGKNGSGKSTIARVLGVMQGIGRGQNKVAQLVKKKDMGRGREDRPVRFRLEALLDGKTFKYELALELPEKFRELRVLDEQLTIDGDVIYSRSHADVELRASGTDAGASFSFDWHSIALTIIQPRRSAEALLMFKNWLARMMILVPIPALMTGESEGDDTLEPVANGSNFGNWFSGLLRRYPAAYTTVDQFLKGVLPDFDAIENRDAGKDAKTLLVKFAANGAGIEIDFVDLSDGEKCFFLFAVVLAANKHYGPLFCYWDEPDNYLSLSEVGHFVMGLRRSVLAGGQLVMASHNPEAVRVFSDDNTVVLGRKNHLEPTLGTRLDKLGIAGDVVDAMIRGDVEL